MDDFDGIEIEDPGDAETILAALNKQAAEEYRTASAAWDQDNNVLAGYHMDLAGRLDCLATRFQEALYPEPEPPDFEAEPPLPKDDRDYTAGELLQIQRQSKVVA